MGTRATRWAPLLAALVTFAVVVGVVAAVVAARGGSSPSADSPDTAAPVSAQVVQLRRDEVASRVEVALTNVTSGAVQVEAIRLRVGGLTGAGWVPLDYPLPPGGPVNFITKYGESRCPGTGAPQLGAIRVDVRWHTDADPSRRTSVVAPSASRGLLRRIQRGECRERTLTSQVHLAFGPAWRTEGAGEDIRLHTTLEARLTPGSPSRDVAQVSGSILYALAPDPVSPAAPPAPLAALDPAHPSASVPVVVTQARCTGHAKGEVKQPYLFLVWLGDPGTPGSAVEVPVSDADKARLRAVCAF